MKSKDDTDDIRTSEKLWFYFLVFSDFAYFAVLMVSQLGYYLVWRIYSLPFYLLPKKKQAINPFTKLKSEQLDKKTLLLDLDGTLVNSSAAFSEGALKIRVGKDFLYVRKRSYLDEFIGEMNELFTLGVYTSSVSEYADKVLNVIGLDKVIPKNMRFYRDSCEYYNGNYMKRITKIEADLRNVLILDDRPEVIIDKKNFIGIKPWDYEIDHELIKCAAKLRLLCSCSDVRIYTNSLVST